MGRWPLAAMLAASLSCADPPDPELLPDAVLQRELGLTDADRVHSVRVAGGDLETADPPVVSIAPGAYVQFVTTDWFVHEVRFEVDSLGPDGRAFLERSDQVASPPLVFEDSRFVVTFDGAPPGRYPYVLEGNGRPGHGAIVVLAPAAR